MPRFRESLHDAMKAYHSALATLHAAGAVFGNEANRQLVGDVMHLEGEAIDALIDRLETDTQTLHQLFANVEQLLDKIPGETTDRFFIDDELS